MRRRTNNPSSHFRPVIRRRYSHTGRDLEGRCHVVGEGGTCHRLGGRSMPLRRERAEIRENRCFVLARWAGIPIHNDAFPKSTRHGLLLAAFAPCRRRWRASLSRRSAPHSKVAPRSAEWENVFGCGLSLQRSGDLMLQVATSHLIAGRSGVECSSSRAPACYTY